MTEMGGKDIQTRLKILHILWIALVGAVIVYGVVAYVIATSGDAEQDAIVPILRLVFTAVSVVTAAVSFWWRRSFVVTPGGPFSLSVKEPGVPLSPEEQATVLERLFVNCLIVWALCESVALYGLVLVLLSHNATEFMPFGCGALALLLLHRPAAWPIGRSLGPGMLH